MKEFFKSLKKSYVLLAIAYIILGILLLIFQKIVPIIMICGFGAMLIIFGLISIIDNFKNDNSNGFSDFGMVSGIINIGLGAFFIFNYQNVGQVIAFVIGMLFIVDSFIKFQKAIDLLHVKYKYWWFTLLFAIITIILGVIIVVISFNNKNTGYIFDGMAIITGISLIVVGITDIWIVSKVSKYIKEVLPEEVEIIEVSDEDKEN